MQQSYPQICVFIVRYFEIISSNNYYLNQAFSGQVLKIQKIILDWPQQWRGIEFELRKDSGNNMIVVSGEIARQLNQQNQVHKHWSYRAKNTLTALYSGSVDIPTQSVVVAMSNCVATAALLRISALGN